MWFCTNSKSHIRMYVRRYFAEINNFNSKIKRFECC